MFSLCFFLCLLCYYYVLLCLLLCFYYVPICTPCPPRQRKFNDAGGGERWVGVVAAGGGGRGGPGLHEGEGSLECGRQTGVCGCVFVVRQPGSTGIYTVARRDALVIGGEALEVDLGLQAAREDVVDRQSQHVVYLRSLTQQPASLQRAEQVLLLAGEVALGGINPADQLHGVPAPATQLATRLPDLPVAADALAVAQTVVEDQLLLLDDALGSRSEEHTSELQSQAYLVCRLLLEKKKQTKE